MGVGVGQGGRGGRGVRERTSMQAWTRSGTAKIARKKRRVAVQRPWPVLRWTVSLTMSKSRGLRKKEGG